MNFEKLLGQQASKNLKCNPFQSSLSCFKRLFTFSVSHRCFTQFNGSFHRVVWFFSQYLASNSWKNFRHSGIVLSPWKSSETMRIAFVAWRFCRTHYWAANPQKRAHYYKEHSKWLSFHFLLIGKVARALFALRIIHLNLLLLSVSCVLRDFLYLKVFFSNSCLFKLR